MTTIIRVKRHRAEDPVEALVLSCKRKRTEDSPIRSNFSSVKYVLNFSGTVEEKDDKIAASTVETFIKGPKHTDLSSKEHKPDVRNKQRRERKDKSDEDRFTLLSCLRSSFAAESDHSTDGTSQKNVTIVDVSRDNDDSVSNLNTSESSYVYDLYSTNVDNDSDYNDMFMEHLLSVQPLESELTYRSGEDYDEIDPDEDDSNDENNWRNDYPDSDVYEDEDDDNEDGDFLSRRLRNVHMVSGSDEYESSDNSDVEGMYNYKDDEKYYYYDVDDVPGSRYERYKRAVMKDLLKGGDGDGGQYDRDEDGDSDDEYRDCEDDFYGTSD